MIRTLFLPVHDCCLWRVIDKKHASSDLRGFPIRSGGGGGDRFVDERYEVLRILDFTSARKRMSVIVRDPDGYEKDTSSARNQY